MANIYNIQGKVNESLGNYEEALENYRKHLEIIATSFDLHTDIARCYRLLKNYKEAEAEIKSSLKYDPYNPEANYEAALLYIDMGNRAKGREYLEKAVEIWKDADQDYKPAFKARENLNSLQ